MKISFANKEKTILVRKLFLVIILSIDIIAIIVALMLGQSPEQYFGEGTFITYLSFFQLSVVSILAGIIFGIRISEASFKWPFLIWLFIAIAFVYLSLDEICEVHENLDFFIHRIFNIQETGFTDRIDDVVVGCYGLFGLIILYSSRDEFKKYSEAFPLLKVGFVFMFIMVAFDILTNRYDILQMVVSNPVISKKIFSWLNAFEDIFKIIAEGIFVGAFYYCLGIARRITH